MKPPLRFLASGAVALGLTLTSALAQTMDTMVFGNTGSEAKHALTTYFPPPSDTTIVGWVNTPPPSNPSATAPSEVVAGGLGLSARRLLPRTPNGDIYGGQMTFTMNVDPVKQNYFTLKMWGSDPQNNGYLILNCNGKEIGNRHGGGGLNEDPLYYSGGGWYPNRFFYRTEPLPLSMTKGQATVTITVRSSGSIYYYASIWDYVPNYQHLMTAPSPSVYTAYTHAGSTVDVSGEPQGTAPAVLTPRALENETTVIATTKTNVNNSLAGKLNAVGANLSQSDASFLAQCYDAKANTGASWITYPAGKTDADLGNQIIAALDQVVTNYALDPTVATGGWGGALGDMGDAVRLAWPLISGSMSSTVAYGGTVGTVTRQAGWSAALRASVDGGRFARRTIANQEIACGWTIYRANRGLLLVDAANALLENEGLRYFKEGAGILPYMGNDQPGGGPVPVKGTQPYGPDWYLSTTYGTTKDGDGFVGSDYGELGTWVYKAGLLSGDASIKARGIKMTKARAPFRYPGVDDAGYLIMMGTDPIGVRNNDLPSHYAYLGRGYGDDLLMASQGAAAIGNDLLGYYQQAMNDGQLVRSTFGTDPYIPGRWAAFRAMPQTGVKLPTTAGEPDSATVDEENMVVAAKHGEERFYANLYWRQPGFINGLAKVFYLTPTNARLADVMVDDVRFRPTGSFIVTSNSVDNSKSPTAPDFPVEAFGGQYAPTAWRSDLSSIPPTNRDAGRGTGYTFRYGNWLVGINAHYSDTYTVQLPSNFTSATDLISGTVKSGPIVLAPKTSVVFYLPTSFDPAPPPSRSLFVSASGSNGSVAVGWYAAGAATSYNVLRSTSSGGPYTTIATGVAGTSYNDTAVSNGTTYFYAVESVNATGTSGSSPEASGTPTAPATAGLPAPWSDADTGTSTGGNATISSGTFTVKSGPGDISGSNDACHVLYQPMIGDGVITAQVQSQSSTNTSARAGVMIRGSLAFRSAGAIMAMQRNNASIFLARSTDGNTNTSNTSYGTTLAMPYWVRLVRSSTTITGYVSPDGATWTKVASYTFGNLPYVVYAGLVSSPVNSGAGQTNTATFTNVNLPAGASSAPSAPTGLTAASGNSTVTLNWSTVSNASTYTVKRGTSAGGPFITVATGLANTTYTDYGQSQPTGSYYVVSAVNSAGESANSTVVAAPSGALPAAVTGLTATLGSGQVGLSWNASAGATSYTITRSVSGAAATVVASGLSATSYTQTGLSDGTLYYFGVIPVNAVGQGQGTQIPAMPPGIASGWQSQDIGLSQLGGASVSNGTFTAVGRGRDIWGTADQLGYTYRVARGDCAIIARLTGVTDPDSYKIGVMIRSSLDADSTQASLLFSSTGGVAFERRSSTTGSTSASYPAGVWAMPAWAMIVRSGNTIIGYLSADGVTWTYAGSTSITLNADALIGLAVCSQDPSAQSTATFDNVSVLLDTANGGTASANVAGPSGQQAPQAFDTNVGSKWYNNVTSGTTGNAGYVRYQFGGGASKTITQYVVTCASDTPQRDPKNWQLQGSNDGLAWTTLDTQSAQTFASRSQGKAYTVPTALVAPYKYYQLNVTANAGGSGYGLQIGELALFAPELNNAPPAPLAPTGLSAAWTNGQIDLSWIPCFGATSYNLKRSTTSGSSYTTIASNLTGTTYSDSGLTNGTTYYYVVTAVNATGESPNSVENSAMPIAAPGTPGGLTITPGDGQALLSWTGVAGANSYVISRSTMSGGSFQPIGISTSASYTDIGLTNGTTYYYRITAVNLAAESVVSTVTSVFVAPAPAAPAASTQSGDAQAVVSWNAPTWATSYTVKRAAASGGAYTTIASGLTATSYTDTGLTNGTRYYYVVSAANASGTSPDSRQVSATPGVLGAGFLSSDIGAVTVTGTASNSNGTYTVTGAGDIWNAADTLRYTYQPISGDATIVARVASQTTGKAGVMIRETLAANSRQVDMNLHKGFGTKMELRASTGGNSSNPGRGVGSAPYWVKLSRVGNVFTGSVSADGATWTQVAQSTVTMSSAAYIGLMEGSGNASTLATATFDGVSVASAPSPWQSIDVGTAAVPGDAVAIGGGYNVTSSGADIWGTADAFRYVYQPATGDCDITVRVADVQATHNSAKAGVMIRETLNANSAHAMVDLTPVGIVEFIRRGSTGSTSGVTSAAGVSAPQWVRLVRSGNTFTASYSGDGAQWTTLGSASIPMATSVYLGLPVSSHVDGVLNSAIIDNVTATP